MIAPINSLIGKQPLANIATNSPAINSMADAVNKLRNLTFDSRYFSVIQNPAGIFVTTRPTVIPAMFPWGEIYTFGITDTSADGTYKLKVWKGKFRRWGDQTYFAADTEVTFSGDGDQWLVWRWSESSGLEIVTTPQTNYPAEADSTYIYGPIHQVNLTSGVFTVLDACQDGIINAPVFTAAGA